MSAERHKVLPGLKAAADKAATALKQEVEVDGPARIKRLQAQVITTRKEYDRAAEHLSEQERALRVELTASRPAAITAFSERCAVKRHAVQQLSFRQNEVQDYLGLTRSFVNIAAWKSEALDDIRHADAEVGSLMFQPITEAEIEKAIAKIEADLTKKLRTAHGVRCVCAGGSENPLNPQYIEKGTVLIELGAIA